MKQMVVRLGAYFEGVATGASDFFLTLAPLDDQPC